MKLPGDAIGISDLLDHRECPQRMALGMRRHTEDPVPGETDWTTAYGSAIHDAIHLVETEGLGNEEAVERVWPTYGGYLSPDELALLKEDLNSYRGDTPLGMELVAAEKDCRVPLFIHDGRWIYFRFKIDALYRRIDDHTSFYQRDYKSSKWPKSQKEVDEDLQQWAYNWGVFELFPECSSLTQSYEMLRFGNKLTSKNAEQRTQMKAWLIESVKAVLADETLEPKQNQWCPWCSLAPTCDQSRRAVPYWKGMLAMLAPLTTEGRKTKVEFAGEMVDLEDMIENVLPQMMQTRRHMEAVEKALKGVIERLPTEERSRLGWRVADRKTRVLPPEGIKAVHEALGPSFYEVVSLSRSSVETLVGKPKRGEEPAPQLKLLRELELERVSSSSVVADS